MGNNNPNILDVRFIIGGPCVDYGWRCSYSYIWVQKNRELFVGGVFLNHLQGFVNCICNACLVNVKNGLKLKVVPIGHLTLILNCAHNHP
jgi:hypothetical protein